MEGVKNIHKGGFQNGGRRAQNPDPPKLYNIQEPARFVG